MGSVKENKPLLELENDDLAELDHVEVRHYAQYKKTSRFRKAFDQFLGAATNTTAAVDDSYSVFSSFASHGLTLSKAIFFILGAILTLNYFLTSRQKQKDTRKSFQKSLNNIGDTIIPDTQYELWEKQLTRLGERELAEDIETTVKNAHADDFLEHIEEEFERASKLLNEFIFDLDEKKLAANVILKNQIDTIQFIHGQLALNAEATSRKIKSSKKIQNVLEKLPENNYQPPWQKKLKKRSRKAWHTLLHNYADIFSGITLAGTFGSIALSFTGVGIVAIFPYNILFAISLVAITAGGSFSAKHYFRKRLRKYNSRKQKLKHNIRNKRLLMDLIVTTKQFRSQLNLAIEEYYIIKDEVSTLATEDKTKQAQLREALENHPEVDEAFDLEEHVEVTEFKKKSQLLRHTLGYTLPTIFAISAGYSVGATLLQLTLFAGIGTPLLPFIIIGLVCVGIYATHAIWNAYQCFKKEHEDLCALNKTVVSPERIQVLENRLKLNDRYGIKHNNQLYTVEQYVKNHTAQSISDHLLAEIDAMRDQFGAAKKSENTEVFDKQLLMMLEQIQAQLVDRLTIQSQKLGTQKLASELRMKLRGVQPLNVENPVTELSRKEQIIRGCKMIGRYLNKNLKTLLDGTTFGLSTSASILLIFGTASLFSLVTTIAILITGAAVGSIIALTNKHVQEYQATYRRERKAVKAIVRDKGELTEMLVQTLQARDQVSLLIEASYQPIRMARTDDLSIESSIMPQSPSSELEDIQQKVKQIRARHLVSQLAQSLSMTLQDKQPNELDEINASLLDTKQPLLNVK